MTDKCLPKKAKTLQIRMTDDERALVRDAARRERLTASDFGRKLLLAAMLEKRDPLGAEQKARADADQLAALLEERREKEARDAATLAKLENFRLLFVDAMELSLTGKLTVARLRGLVERRSA